MGLHTTQNILYAWFCWTHKLRWGFGKSLEFSPFSEKLFPPPPTVPKPFFVPFVKNAFWRILPFTEKAFSIISFHGSWKESNKKTFNYFLYFEQFPNSLKCTIMNLKSDKHKNATYLKMIYLKTVENEKNILRAFKNIFERWSLIILKITFDPSG